MPESIGDRWRELMSAGVDQIREADAELPLRFLFGVNGSGQALLVVVSLEKPSVPDLSPAVMVERGRRQIDRRWALTMICADETLTDTFITLGEDLVQTCADADSEREALQRFLAAVEEWKRLLRNRSSHLPEPALRALIAELWLGFRSPHVSWQPSDAAFAWGRPLGESQDYTFPDNKRVVVRNLTPDTEVVSIECLAQLNEQPTDLAVVTMSRVADQHDAVTLPSLADTIRSAFAEPSQRAEFNRRLAHLGVNLDDPWYQDFAYSLQRIRFFETAAPFPALRRGEVPQAIRSARYRLDLAMTSDFCTMDEVIDPTREHSA